MKKHIIHKLHNELVDHGLKSSIHTGVEEMVGNELIGNE